MTFDSTLMMLGITLELLIVAIVFRRGIYRMLPVFAGYMIWGPVSDCWGLLALTHSGSSSSALYLAMFQIEMPLDSLIQFAVFVELAWAALRPFKSLHPLRTVVGLSILIAACGVVIWPIAGTLPIAHFPAPYRSLYHLGYTISILRVALCLLLAACSQILSIDWRNRELQVATGLGFFSLVSLAATILHSHQSSASSYHIVDVMTSISYLLSLAYWGLVFRKSEAPRRQFSPEMQRVLLSVARAGRATLESIPSR